MILKGTWAGQSMVMIGVYAPLNARSAFWQEVWDLVIDDKKKSQTSLTSSKYGQQCEVSSYKYCIIHDLKIKFQRIESLTYQPAEKTC